LLGGELLKDAKRATSSGRAGDAAPLFRESKALSSRALELKPNHFYLVMSLAQAEWGLRQNAAAFQTARRATEIWPDVAEAHALAGLILRTDGDDAEALDWLERAHELDPDHYNANLHLGLLHRSDAPSRAADHLQDAARNAPDAGTYRQAVLQLAWLRATSREEAVRDGAEALELVTSLGATTPQSERVEAAALAELGRTDEAVARLEPWFETALREGQLEIAATLRPELESYRAGRPYRE